MCSQYRTIPTQQMFLNKCYVEIVLYVLFVACGVCVVCLYPSFNQKQVYAPDQPIGSPETELRADLLLRSIGIDPVSLSAVEHDGQKVYHISHLLSFSS